MAYSGNIGSYLYPVGEAHAGDFAQSRIGLLWRSRINANTDPALLGTALKGRGARFFPDLFPTFSDQLIDSGHSYFCSSSKKLIEIQLSYGVSVFRAGKSLLFKGIEPLCQAFSST
jgi:hypothetical protein